MNKNKWLKIILILFSTLLFPLQYSSFLLVFIPMTYVSFVVPYWLWLIIDGKKRILNLYHLFWQIPLILCLAVIQCSAEIMIVLLPAVFNAGFYGGLAMIAVCLLVLRIITYVFMILVWQPDFFKPHIKTSVFLMIIYIICGGYFIYEVKNAPDIPSEMTMSFADNIKFG